MLCWVWGCRIWPISMQDGILEVWRRSTSIEDENLRPWPRRSNRPEPGLRSGFCFAFAFETCLDKSRLIGRPRCYHILWHIVLNIVHFQLIVIIRMIKTFCMAMSKCDSNATAQYSVSRGIGLLNSRHIHHGSLHWELICLYMLQKVLSAMQCQQLPSPQQIIEVCD
jgi:hypothetical protein